MNQKKRHHYIPIAYLKEFCASDGRIFAYRKGAPDQELHLSPKEIAFERYYYSQPLADNKQDNNKIEDAFSVIENLWPATVDGFRNCEPSSNANLTAFFQFLGMMRVRVPATRDIVESALAESVRSFARNLDRQGKLPPKPKGYENTLDQVEVSIDPHKSIHAMADLARGFSKVVDRLGFRVLHNRSDHTFITSDNPVAYYDPDVPETSIVPYDINLMFGRIELLFPVNSNLLVVGRSDWKPSFSVSGMSYLHTADSQRVKRLNRLIARFGYRLVFSNTSAHRPLAKKYSTTAPILETTIVKSDEGENLSFRSVFGPHKTKPKWVRPLN